MTTPSPAQATPAPAAPGPAAPRVRRREWLHILARAARTPRGMVGLGLALVVVLIAVIGPFVVPHPPDAFVTVPGSPPSAKFPLCLLYTSDAADE